MTYRSHVEPDIVVGALNNMIDEAGAGKLIRFKSIFFLFKDNCTIHYII